MKNKKSSDYLERGLKTPAKQIIANTTQNMEIAIRLIRSLSSVCNILLRIRRTILVKRAIIKNPRAILFLFIRPPLGINQIPHLTNFGGFMLIFHFTKTN